MRGKEYSTQRVNLLDRITPAYAGKRFRFTPVLFGLRDHPRLCGEKVFRIPMRQTFLGSPPPMRGKVVQLFDLLLRVRITPAYAGKSQRHADTADRHEDHPRLCGEKALLRCVVCGRRGSPPPMRGKVCEKF